MRLGTRRVTVQKMSWTENSLQDVKQTYFFSLFSFSFWSIDQRQNFHFPIMLYSNHRKKTKSSLGSHVGFKPGRTLVTMFVIAIVRIQVPDGVLTLSPSIRAGAVSSLLGWGEVCGGQLRGEEGWCAVYQGPWCDQSIQLWSLVVGLIVQRMQTCSVTCPWMFVCIFLFFVLFINMHGKMKERLKKKQKTTMTTTTQRWKNEWRRPTRLVWEEMG